jgi:hypothetical protein
LHAKYDEEMVKHHGEGYKWQKEPIDPIAVHASGGGKVHGQLEYHSLPFDIVFN